MKPLEKENVSKSKIMRIALFSDIHGNLTGLRAVLAAIDSMGGANVTIAAGDLVGGESGTNEILELLLDREVRMVQGDNDTQEKLVRLENEARTNPGSTRSPAWYYQAMREWLHTNLSSENRLLLDTLPLSLTVEAAPNQRLYVCHASPRSVSDRVCAASCDVQTVRDAFGGVAAEIIAFGHAHEAFVRLLDGRPLVNVASVGLRRDGLSRFTLLTFTEGHWQIAQHAAPYDVTAEMERRRERAVPYFP